MNKTQKLYRRAKSIVPGGTQLLSKRPEMFLPGGWPAYYKKAKGCRVWDLDGRRYTDMSYMGIGACILGYADNDVDKAVEASIRDGNMSTLNAPEEVYLAEKLIRLHQWSGMVRYARTGGEAMAMAVRIARAKSRKDVVLFCGYHGWHDWYLAANLGKDGSLDGHLLPGLEPLGVPRSLAGTSIPFEYNDTKGFIGLVDRHRRDIGAIVMEPVRSAYPQKGFLETVRQVSKDIKAVLVFDEITSGWRLNTGGAHMTFGIYPDIAVFAKGMSNGFPMAAVIGKKSVMDAAQSTFISSTYWTDRAGPAAALAAIAKIERLRVPDHLTRTGRRIKAMWNSASSKYGVKIKIVGIDPLPVFSFEDKRNMIFKTLFTQEMLKRGFLASNGFYASLAHEEGDLDRYEKALDVVFDIVSKAAKEDKPAARLKGAVCQTGFKRLT
jgi:glutamate-1-semialdehyde aminotransferase